jgi:hypothetical protein
MVIAKIISICILRDITSVTEVIGSGRTEHNMSRQEPTRSYTHCSLTTHHVPKLLEVQQLGFRKR